MTAPAGTCPNCGAEIVFRWSGAVQTTCPACRSILVRHDLNLEKVGVAADVPEAMSAIQLGTEGSFKKKAFTVVGRIIYKYELGHWNEWHIRFTDDTSGWLSDAQAEYAVTRASTQQIRAVPGVGEDVVIEKKIFKAMSVTKAAYAGVEGELPFEYWDKSEVSFTDLRGDGDTFATIDESESPPLVFVGEYEDFTELRLKNLREDVPTGAAPQTRSLSCASCGAAIILRTGEAAKTVACAACGAVMDASDAGLKILLQHQARLQHNVPQIALGRTGQLKGKRWTVIGYQVRGITVDGTDYEWREYLLWNPEAGFRYLTEYDGHWNDVNVVKGLPKEITSGARPAAEYLGTRFEHFQRAQVTTKFVLGEFPWEVRVGDKVWNDDYVAPPLMLSRESTPSEITWSLGTYVTPQLIQEAFKLETPLPRPVGVFANQPNPATATSGLGKLFVVFACLLMGMCAVRQATARNETAFSGGYRFNPATGDTAAFVTKVFDLKGHPSNAEVEIFTDLSNDNAFFSVALLPEGTGKGYELGREVSYYFGYEDGESWTEGGNGDRAVIADVPPGRYYLRIEPEHAGTTPVSYTVSVKRDVPRVWPFLAGLVPLMLPALFGFISKSSFEGRRWAESDYAPSGDDDDDDDDNDSE